MLGLLADHVFHPSAGLDLPRDDILKLAALLVDDACMFALHPHDLVLCKLHLVLALDLLLVKLGELGLALAQAGLDAGGSVKREFVLLVEGSDLVLALAQCLCEPLGVLLLRTQLVVELDTDVSIKFICEC